MLHIRSICIGCVLYGYRPLFGLDTMTIIVGLADAAGMCIGGDRAASDTKYVESMVNSKIMQYGDYLLGYAGNIGVGQLIFHSFEAPIVSEPYEMYSVFVPALRSFLNESGMQPESYNGDDASQLIICTMNRVYSFNCQDTQLIEHDGYTAIGSGSGLALGSLYTTSKWKNKQARVAKALLAACAFNVTCQEPIDVLETWKIL